MNANPTEVVKQPDGRLTVKVAGLNGGEDSCIPDNDQVVLAVGRGSKTKGLGLEEAGVEMGEWCERGRGTG
jgi:pyruvate/2-oxoglutarate dehydrogenase complex dihydrolipoamide dehydrogenase (E3) component